MKNEDVTANEARRKIMPIDSKSFYASVESVSLGLNPMKLLLVVMSQQENTNGLMAVWCWRRLRGLKVSLALKM